MSSSRVKKLQENDFQETQKTYAEKTKVSMNEIRIDKLAFTFKTKICHYYILLKKTYFKLLEE